MRFAKQAVREIANRFGRRVDEQANRLTLPISLRENLGPLLRVLGLPEKRREQVFAELPRGVGR